MTTTFTASQGLLLMIPNMYKIAGELTPPFCMHVAARTVATHALSIFGDHSDVMAAARPALPCWRRARCRRLTTMPCIAQAATLRTRVPFLHFFDGFRTSHEVTKVEALDDESCAPCSTIDLVAAHRERALTPDHPVLRGTAQNPDVFFQAREAANPFYDACAASWSRIGDGPFRRTRPGRRYRLFDYVGSIPRPSASMVMMGSGAETAARDRRRWIWSARREGGAAWSRCGSTDRSRLEHFVGGTAGSASRDRGAGPHQRARCGRRAALPGRRRQR